MRDQLLELGNIGPNMGQLDLNAAFIFTQVVAAGSFRAAAVQLGIPKSNVSRKVAELEAHLGVRLLQRTTRSLSLTDAGMAFMAQAENAISFMKAAEDAVTAIQIEPRGRIRISAPNLLANTLLPPILGEFMQTYPQVELVLQLTNRHVDLVNERIDVAIRVGSLADSSLVATTIGQATMVLVASPAYLQKHGTPQHPQELSNHACLVFAVQASTNQTVWQLGKGRTALEVTLKNRPLICDDLNVILNMALQGQGIARLPLPFVAEECARQRLQQILPEWAKDAAPLQLVYPNAKHLLPATRAFIDFVKPRLKIQGESTLTSNHGPSAKPPSTRMGAVVLAGGQGSRMNGLDKGMQLLQGHSLVSHAVQRLTTQTQPPEMVLINANRHLKEYQALGFDVWPDAQADHAGPLAGFLVGMTHCPQPYLLTVPCDTPLFPLNLAEKLLHALQSQGADIAMAAAPEEDGVLRRQPVFCLMKVTLKESLQKFLTDGGRKIGAWTALHHTVEVPFEDPLAFRNLNTPEDFQQLESQLRH